MQLFTFILALFSFLGLALIILVVHLKMNGHGVLGKTTLNKVLFYTGKPSLFASWFLMCFKAIKPELGCVYMPFEVQLLSAFVLAIGTAITLISFVNLGLSTRMGIPTDNTTLKTKGLYRFSRNPMYVGFFLVSIASCVYFPGLFNIPLAAYGIVTHHLIVLEEEKFLSKQFGSQWTEYIKRTRRYL